MFWPDFTGRTPDSSTEISLDYRHVNKLLHTYLNMVVHNCITQAEGMFLLKNNLKRVKSSYKIHPAGSQHCVPLNTLNFAYLSTKTHQLLNKISVP